MNNFPAMTEEQRQVLIGRLQIYIRTAETAIKAGLATKEDVFNLTVWKIALAALTAKSIAWIETGTDGFQRGSRLINYFTSDIQGFDNGTLIYAAPPAPVLKPIELPCADHETDAGYEFYRKETVIQAIRAAGYEVKQ